MNNTARKLEEAEVMESGTGSQALEFSRRHIGPSETEIAAMLKTVGYPSLEKFIEAVVPSAIRAAGTFALTDFPQGQDEQAALNRLARLAQKNEVRRSFIGTGYYNCFVPTVILRNILENPNWYTAYTPYQPEISQGRLEALLNYQTMIIDLTGLDVANASLLDEGTAAAEAMAMSHAIREKNGPGATTYFISDECHPQTIAVVKNRAEALGFKVVVGSHQNYKFNAETFGALVQYPATGGEIYDYSGFVANAHQAGAVVTMAADILSLLLLKSPGSIGADIAVGSAQRFGVPYGYGGPHAGYMATKDDYKRIMPGRLIGVSKDSRGKPAMRLSLQTREQHIRREKATSNICTAQVLLAVMASMYAVYHGPKGLRAIAERVNGFTKNLATELSKAGATVVTKQFFDTLTVKVTDGAGVLTRSDAKKINLRQIDKNTFGVSLDESTRATDVQDIVEVLTGKRPSAATPTSALDAKLLRTDAVLAHPVFNTYHSESEFLRYLKRLEAKDLSLAFSMIPLGSCTMKLNATSEMIPVTWKEIGQIHPFVPRAQAAGYKEIFTELERGLAEITGFAATSLQPNAGSQGEYAGLLVIRRYLESIGQGHRKICLIPRSAHGTNPASAVMAGLEVVVTNCDDRGNVDVADLKLKVEEHKANLAALMMTYPSTHGVFEQTVKEICKIIHDAGGQVYMDGANLNALVGLCKPGEFGADVSHINLHKTFCIPHGGGGPGMGPIGVKAHLAPFLPNHPVVSPGHAQGIGPVSAAPWGSASILTISWMYMAMMGAAGLKRATEIAMLNANYIAERLEAHFPVLYRGANRRVAHECIVDVRQLKAATGVEVEDVAKRLMDYGFHAPTISFPVPGTIMIEPTESESKVELDRFCEAMIAIREEIREIETGKADKVNNVLKHAPHTMDVVMSDSWDRPYSREKAAFPTAWIKETKFWPAVGRIDSAYGDKNLVCSCLPIEEYSK